VTKRITILGSTGSIGRSALDVVRHYPDRFEVVGLAARSNAELLAEQIDEFAPKHAVLVDEEAARRLGKINAGCVLTMGRQALEDLASVPVDVVLCGVVGAVGLRPILCAIDAGNRIALANKEPLVLSLIHI